MVGKPTKLDGWKSWFQTLIKHGMIWGVKSHPYFWFNSHLLNHCAKRNFFFSGQAAEWSENAHDKTYVYPKWPGVDFLDHQDPGCNKKPMVFHKTWLLMVYRGWKTGRDYNKPLSVGKMSFLFHMDVEPQIGVGFYPPQIIPCLKRGWNPIIFTIPFLGV